jgi:hypothetical protein
MESPRPRVTAMSLRVGFFGSSGRRARLPASAGLSLAKDTSISLSPEMARMHTVAQDVARLACYQSPGLAIAPAFGFARELSPGPAIG